MDGHWILGEGAAGEGDAAGVVAAGADIVVDGDEEDMYYEWYKGSYWYWWGGYWWIFHSRTATYWRWVRGSCGGWTQNF